MGIMLQMRTAAAGVRYDGVELFRPELLDLFARQDLGSLPFAVVRMKGTATILIGGRDYLAAISGQNFDCIHIHLAEHQVLHATRQHAHTIVFWTFRWCD